MSQNEAIKLITSFYDYYNVQNFGALYELFDEEVIYSINASPESTGKQSFIQHMQQSVEVYREKLIEVVPMANLNGTFASASFRFKGQYFGDGKELYMELQHRGHTYDLPGYNFFVIKNGKITEIKAFFNEAELKRQILAKDEALTDAF